MITMTAGFLTKLQAQHNQPRIRFTYDGSNYDAYVLGISQLRRDAKLSTGIVTVRVANADQQWNNFISDLTDLGLVSAVKLYFLGDSEYLPLFSGKVEKVEYAGAETILSIRDRLAEMMEIPIGSGGSPVSTYYGTSVNPASLVWDILTNASYGNLDDTESTANTDIDYAAWSAWHTTYCAGQNFKVAARLTGQTIRTVLQEVAYLTSSEISINADGKLDFHPPYNTGTGMSFNASTAKPIDLSISKEDICNQIQFFFGYDPPNDSWDGTYTDNTSNDASTSQSTYGVKRVTEEGKVVWHANQTSANNACEQVLNNWAWPVKEISISGMMKGYVCEIGDVITVTEPLKGLSNASVRIEEIPAIRIPDGTIDIVGRITS